MHRYAAALLFALMALLLAASGANAAAPALTITPSYFGNAGTNGWYVGPVTVNWDIEPKDPGNTSSGCDGVKIAVETTGTTVTCTAWNADGAKFQTTTKLIKIDMTPPAASLAPSRGPDSGGWYNHSVSVSFAGNDAISGIDSCSAVKSYSGPDSESAVISGSCTDKAGNVGSVSFGFKYDSTAPSVTAVPARGPDANGWYNHAIAVAFSGSDGASGIASCTAATYAGPDNPSTAVTGSCTDNAGNVRTGTLPLKYDSTPPTLSKVTAKAGNRRLDLAWVASGAQVIHVSRTSNARGVKAGLVYSGTGAGFRDTRLKVGARYRYTVTAIDQAGNSVSKALAVTATGALLAPTPAQTVSRPPLLRWTPVKGAGYYNVQLVRGKKILSAWPATNHFRVPRSWIFEGHRYRLHRGVYRWYVWPGFGTFSSNRYGTVLGGSSFVFSPG